MTYKGETKNWHVYNDKDNGPKITKEVLYTTQEGHIFNQIKLYLSLVVKSISKHCGSTLFCTNVVYLIPSYSFMTCTIV